MNKNDGSRANTSSCYLNPARHRQNLKILPNSLAERVIFNGTTATGVEISSFRDQSGTLYFYLSRQILVGLRNRQSRGKRNYTVRWCYQLAANATAFWNRKL